ncbi:MAG: tyrosine-type recombinase/integrase [Clostridiales bacterium]|nr:tyrosine-type recombinase/integrase [Clostridiales bacterium]
MGQAARLEFQQAGIVIPLKLILTDRILIILSAGIAFQLKGKNGDAVEEDYKFNALTVFVPDFLHHREYILLIQRLRLLVEGGGRLAVHEGQRYAVIKLHAVLQYIQQAAAFLVDLIVDVVEVHLEEQYFDVIASKTENDLRKVHIADKVLPFYKAWYEGSQCEYLLHTPDQKHFDYRNYYDSYFTPLMEQLGYDQTPHCTWHACISMLTEAHVDQTMIKKIVGHSGAMTLTERAYTHLDIETLVEAINKI